MKTPAQKLLKSIAAYTLAAFASSAYGQATTRPAPANDLATQKTLYTVGYAHLDTQWRWTYALTTRDFIRDTMRDNFKLFEQYPDYVFNFSGSRRYEMMKEYYPEDYEKLKGYIASGRWFVCGSCVDEADALVPSAESQVRQVLYGNRFALREFGKTSQESMLPDCFGFPASLPTVLAHCGLRGFSTQKLTWGSAIGIPFKVGVWNGVDGQGVIAALDPGAYTGNVREDLSSSSSWLKRINNTGEKHGVFADYHYFGIGDRGGAPNAQSVQWIEKSVAGKGPIKVISGNAEQLFVDITDAQRPKLPVYQGELLLTEHSAGSATSQAYMKRWNRKSELLADGAERASVAAAWLGGLAYPHARLYDAWDLVLGSQMHDMLPGTSLPKSYEYCWNDYNIALNQFAAIETSALGVVASRLDTQVADGGTPLVIYNPLAIDRQESVEATVPLAGDAKTVRVTGADGKPVPSQVLSNVNGRAKILFLAKVPSVGFSVFTVTSGEAAAAADANGLKVTERTLENPRFRVTLNDAGDISSIIDKTNNQETLREPARLAFHYENPTAFPAWNMDWKDRQQPAREYVDGPATFKIAENGPARVTLEVARHAQGSRFVQRIQLGSGDAADRVDVANTIDWNTHERCLKATFPLVASNPQATYDVQVGAVSRGNNAPKKYEVPQHQWLDLTDKSGNFGMGLLNDSKFASDKPTDDTVRLTLLYTPAVRNEYQDQGTQDIGRHEIVYSLAPHAGDANAGNVSWQARRLNQPLRAYATSVHPGPLGKSFSLLGIDSAQVEVQAIKQSEDGDAVVVRLKEMTGKPTGDVTIKAAAAIASAYEVDGQERRTGDAKIVNGSLVTRLGAYRLQSFAVKLGAPADAAPAATSQAVALAYDTDVVSPNKSLGDGKFDDAGRTFPAEQFPKKLSLDGVDFTFGSAENGAKNAVAARGQTIQIPAGYDRVYVIAAAANGDRDATFKVGDSSVEHRVQDWGGFVGQWDNRLWNEPIPELSYGVKAKMTGLVRAYVKTSPIAWFCSHRHHPTAGDEHYDYSYLFKYGFDVPAGATSITLPNDSAVAVFAASVAKGTNARTVPAAPLHDTFDDRSEAFLPSIDAADRDFDDGTTVAVNHGLYYDQSKLRYTIDGSEPTMKSPAYSGPVYMARSTMLRVRQFAADGTAGPVVEKAVRINDRKAPKLTSASVVGSEVSIEFNEPIDAAAAARASNYDVADASVRSAALSGDGKTVTLQLEKPLLADGRMRVKNLTDRSENANAVADEAVAVAVSRPVFTIESFKSQAEPIEQRVEGLPVEKGAKWAMNYFVRVDRQIGDRTAIAGFGRATDGQSGTGRYFVRLGGDLTFWSCNNDIAALNTRLDVRQWQMLTASYDGRTLRVYKNGEQIGAKDVELAADEPIVRIAPPSPWGASPRAQFRGEIADFTVWNAPLSPNAIRRLAAEGLKKLQGSK